MSSKKRHQVSSSLHFCDVIQRISVAEIIETVTVLFSENHHNAGMPSGAKLISPYVALGRAYLHLLFKSLKPSKTYTLVLLYI